MTAMTENATIDGVFAYFEERIELARSYLAEGDVHHAGCILINTGVDFEKWRNLEGSAFQDDAP
jgi:hypothetical protein